MGNKDYVFPLPGNVRKVRKIFRLFQPHGIMVLTDWSLEEVTRFYRREFGKQGLTEEKFFTSWSDKHVSMVFSGLPHERSVTIQAIDAAPEQNLRAVTLYTEKRRCSTPRGYKDFSESINDFGSLHPGLNGQSNQLGIYKDWLQQKLTIEEAESKNLIFDSRLGAKGVPFGFGYAAWKALIGQMIEGDELWEFVSPADTWQEQGGRAGIVLVRNGEVVDAIVTLMN